MCEEPPRKKSYPDLPEQTGETWSLPPAPVVPCFTVPSLTSIAARAAGRNMMESPEEPLCSWLSAGANPLCGEELFLTAALSSPSSKPLFWWIDLDKNKIVDLVGKNFTSSILSFALLWLSNDEHPTHRSMVHKSTTQNTKNLCTVTNLVIEKLPLYNTSDVERLAWAYFQSRSYPQLETVTVYLIKKLAKEAGNIYWNENTDKTTASSNSELVSLEAKLVEARTLRAIAMLHCTDVVSARCLLPDSEHSTRIRIGHNPFRVRLSEQATKPMSDLYKVGSKNFVNGAKDPPGTTSSKVELLAREKILHPFHEEPHLLYESIEMSSLRNTAKRILNNFYFEMDVNLSDTEWSRYMEKVNYNKDCKACEDRPLFTKLKPTFATRLLCHIAKIEAALQLQRTAEAVYIGLLALEDLEAETEQTRKKESLKNCPVFNSASEMEKEVANLTWEEIFCVVRVLCLLAESLALISSPPSLALSIIKKASHILQTASNNKTREADVFLRGELMLSTAKVYASLHMFRNAIWTFKNIAKKETGILSVLPSKSYFLWQYLLDYTTCLLKVARVCLLQVELTDTCNVDEFADVPWDDYCLGGDTPMMQLRRQSLLLTKIKFALSEAYEHIQELEDSTALIKDMASCVKARGYVLKLEHNMYNHEYTIFVSTAPKHASERAALRWEIKKNRYILSAQDSHRLNGYAPYGSGPETYWGARHSLINMRYDAFKDYIISPMEARQMCTHATLRIWSNESIDFIIGGAESYSSQGYVDREYAMWNSAADKVMSITNERHPLTCLVYRRLLRSISIHAGQSAEERKKMFNWRLHVAVEIKKEAVRQATTELKNVPSFCDLKNAICTDQHTGAFLMYAHAHHDKLLWVKKTQKDDELSESEHSTTSGYNTDESN